MKKLKGWFLEIYETEVGKYVINAVILFIPYFLLGFEITIIIALGIITGQLDILENKKKI